MSNAHLSTEDILTAAKKSVQANAKLSKRLSITRVFTSAIIAVLLLFVLVTMLAYFRLVDFRVILQSITEKSVPSIALSGQIYSQVNTLTYLTESLTKTSNEPSSRIIKQQLDKQIADLKKLATSDSADPYLQVQLDALTLELNELQQLVQQRLENEKQFQLKLESLYALYDNVMNYAQNNSGSFTWHLAVSEIVAMAGKASNQTRLHELRLLQRQITSKVEVLTSDVKIEPKGMGASYVAQLSENLLSDDGLLALRIEQLRIQGRTIGRGNFVRNLVLDYARIAEYQSYQLNDTVISETQRTSAQVAQQIQLIGVASSVAILFLISVVYFLQYKVVSRLKTLNQMVKQSLEGKEGNLTVTGNDEISDIADTFDIFARTVQKQNQILHDLSLSDPLTGIANRRAFDERLTTEVTLARRHSWDVAILLIDVDFFKAYNDLYGHAAGDDCLKQVANAISGAVHRSTDFVARYGGEEFVCVLPDTDSKGASLKAKNLLKAVEKLNIQHEAENTFGHVTISVGVATHSYSPTDHLAKEVLMECADKALYQAKEAGRNRLSVFSID